MTSNVEGWTEEEFQNAILDPRFAGIFGTETLKFWIRHIGIHIQHHRVPAAPLSQLSFAWARRQRPPKKEIPPELAN